MRRHELSDEEWAIIAPPLPNKPRGVARMDDRRVTNGILWRFRTGVLRPAHEPVQPLRPLAGGRGLGPLAGGGLGRL